MSRKTYLRFKFAVEIFKKNNPYIMKADDDIFMRVPLYLKYLEVLPREKLNMGRAVCHSKEFSCETTWHKIGYASTLARDVVKEIVDYDPLKKLVKSPIKFINFEAYIYFRAINEDIIVGEVIRSKLKFEGLLTVDMKDCRYLMHADHDQKRTANDTTGQPIVFHHISESDYINLKDRHKYDSVVKPSIQKLTKIDEQWGEFQC